MAGIDLYRQVKTTGFWIEGHYWFLSNLLLRVLAAYTETSAFLNTRQTFLLLGLSLYP